MGGAASKAKGGSFERASCKRLSMWVSKSARDDLLWRSAMSGGRSTVQFKKGITNRAQAGDICAIDPLGATLTEQFFIECKHYKNLEMVALFGPSIKTGISAFWHIAKQEAVRVTKLPMLIAKQNFIEPFVCLSSDGLHRTEMRRFVIASFPKRDMHICHFKDFLLYARRPGA